MLFLLMFNCWSKVSFKLLITSLYELHSKQLQNENNTSIISAAVSFQTSAAPSSACDSSCSCRCRWRGGWRCPSSSSWPGWSCPPQLHSLGQHNSVAMDQHTRLRSRMDSWQIRQYIHQNKTAIYLASDVGWGVCLPPMTTVLSCWGGCFGLYFCPMTNGSRASYENKYFCVVKYFLATCGGAS